jgi:ABC-type ATPase involved in cell division
MKGTSVIVATHDWETVRKMQRRIITMERGKVTDDGRTPVKQAGEHKA